MTKLFYILSLLLCFSIPAIHGQAYEQVEPEHFRTVQFKGLSGLSSLPVFRLGEPMQLSFDVLNGEEADFYYTITHYNFDWTESDLSKGEYLDGFDDTRITNYENSLNTLQIFSHYKLAFPNREVRKVTKSGNYLLSIFDDDNNLVFSRKFMIYEELAGVGTEVKRARDISKIGEKQVVQFTVNSPSLLLINPKRNVKTLVIKNNELKRALTHLIPQYTIGTELIYRYDEESSFDAGNEYLYFDNKDVRAANNGVRRVELTDIYDNYLYTSSPRKDRPYTYNPDINGDFQVRNISAENQNIEAEYVRIHFNLQFYENIGNKEIHIYGNFNNCSIDATTYMQYDEASDTYRNSRLFKQGFYNYKYVLVDTDGSIVEGGIDGNFWQTENDYLVLVYYRAPGARYDRIIGRGKANSSKISNN